MENKKFGNYYAEIIVGRAHSQVRTPAWTTFPRFLLGVSCPVLAVRLAPQLSAV